MEVRCVLRGAMGRFWGHLRPILLMQNSPGARGRERRKKPRPGSMGQGAVMQGHTGKGGYFFAGAAGCGGGSEAIPTLPSKALFSKS
jgi:hypothetical protein